MQPDGEEAEEADHDADVHAIRVEELAGDQGEQGALVLTKGDRALKEEILAALVPLDNVGQDVGGEPGGVRVLPGGAVKEGGKEERPNGGIRLDRPGW